MAPDKIYVREYPDGINQFWDRKKRDDVVATIYHEYIRKNALLEWAKKENLKFNQIGNDQDDNFARGVAAGFGYLISKLGSL